MADKKLTKTEIKEGAPFAVLSYIFGLWVLAFIFKNNNKFSLFHARQAAVIFFLSLICLVGQFVPVLGPFFGVVNFFLAVVSLYGIYLSLAGQVKKIPLVAAIADKFIL